MRLTSLAAALAADGEALRGVFRSGPGPRLDRFAAAHHAFASDGVFLHLRRGQHLPGPVLLEFQATQAGTLALPRLVVLAEDGAGGCRRAPLPLARRGAAGGRAPGGSRRRAERPPLPHRGPGVGRRHPRLRSPDHDRGPGRRPGAGRSRPRREERPPLPAPRPPGRRGRRPGPGDLLRPPQPDPGLPLLRGPPRPAHHLQHVPEGRGGRHRPLGVHRPDPHRTGGAGLRRHADQPEPGARRGGRGPLGAQPGDPGQRGALRPRLHGQPPRRRAALLPDEPGPRSRPGPTACRSRGSSRTCSCAFPRPRWSRRSAGR